MGILSPPPLATADVSTSAMVPLTITTLIPSQWHDASKSWLQPPAPNWKHPTNNSWLQPPVPILVLVFLTLAPVWSTAIEQSQPNLIQATQADSACASVPTNCCETNNGWLQPSAPTCVPLLFSLEVATNLSLVPDWNQPPAPNWMLKLTYFSTNLFQQTTPFACKGVRQI